MKDFEEARPAKRDWKRECKELEALVAQQAAALVQKNEALRCIVNKDAWRLYKVNEELLVKDALALQPCPEVLNKVRADAVREAFEGKDFLTYADAMDLAQRIEKGEV